MQQSSSQNGRPAPSPGYFRCISALGQRCRAELPWPAGSDVVTALNAGATGAVPADDFPRRFDHDPALQSAPVLVLFLEPGRVIAHQIAPGFDPTVILSYVDATQKNGRAHVPESADQTTEWRLRTAPAGCPLLALRSRT